MFNKSCALDVDCSFKCHVGAKLSKIEQDAHGLTRLFISLLTGHSPELAQGFPGGPRRSPEPARRLHEIARLSPEVPGGCPKPMSQLLQDDARAGKSCNFLSFGMHLVNFGPRQSVSHFYAQCRCQPDVLLFDTQNIKKS
jgi:hypothetical protein